MKRILQLFTFLLPVMLYSQQNYHPVYFRAMEFYECGCYRNALTYFNELLSIFPEQKEVYFNRGLCLYKSGRYAEAALDMDEVLRCDSTHAEARMVKLLCREKSGDFKESIQLLTELKIKGMYPLDVQHRSRNYRLSSMICNKWYYMIIMAVIAIMLIAVIVSWFGLKRIS
ncbi:MAG: tetratricopeptide repeat protein [Chitinophagales bacterium]|nr:tetratricopeptide repeat protein [Chitinophagales bacterium]MDW8418375.1 tetratricopeptide repeat protein [Chitinophagales bacterium]